MILNDLLNYNLKIYQDKNSFNFSIDSVLLARYAISKIHDSEDILEIGTGNAVIPLILSKELNNYITGVEILADSYKLALKSVEYNNKNNQIKIINKDVNNYFPEKKYKYIICNPPFFKIDHKRISQSYNKSVARHELLLTIDDILRFVRNYMQRNGHFFMIHRSNRFKEISLILNKYDLSFKNVKFIYSKDNENSYMFLSEIVKGNYQSYNIEYPVVINNGDGSYKDEILKNYFGGKDE